MTHLHVASVLFTWSLSTWSPESHPLFVFLSLHQLMGAAPEAGASSFLTACPEGTTSPHRQRPAAPLHTLQRLKSRAVALKGLHGEPTTEMNLLPETAGSAQHCGPCLPCEALDLDTRETLLSDSESSSISHCSATFSENEFNWDTALSGENELIPSLSAFSLSFTEL